MPGKRFREILDSAPAKDVSIELAFARELLQRSLGRPPREDAALLQRLAEAKLRTDFPERVFALLTRAEVRALKPRRPVTESPTASTTPAPQFFLLQSLPKGIADEIVRRSDCTSDWTGLAAAQVDEAGRVTKLDLSGVETLHGCKRALNVMLRASLAEPHSIAGSRSAADIVLIRDRRARLCVEEADVADGWAGAQRLGGRAQTPKVAKRVDPVFPNDARQSMAGSATVVIEALITRQGCVSRMRMLQHAKLGSVNRAALLALSQWQFEPGTLDGKPIDVVFNLTITFRSK